MYRATSATLCLFLAAPAVASDTRELDAHVHGTSALSIAVEGTRIAMELDAPGADIVGFEHAAKSDADRAAIEAAIAALGDPLALFVLPAEAGCGLVSSEVALLGDDAHDHDHDHGEDHADEHGHDEDHAHDDHAHDHDDDHAHSEDHAHDDHGQHTEFRAEYMIDCGDMSAITEIAFPFFERFPNAREIDIEMVTEAGAQRFDVTRETARLDLSTLSFT